MSKYNYSVGGGIGHWSKTPVWNVGSERIVPMFESLIEIVHKAFDFDDDSYLAMSTVQALPLIACEVLNETKGT